MWYNNGIKWKEGYHKDGKKEGTWVSWSYDGKKVEEELYQDGKLAEKKKFDWNNLNKLNIVFTTQFRRYYLHFR